MLLCFTGGVLFSLGLC